MDPALEAFLARARDRVEAYLEEVVPPPDRFPQALFEAMRYSLFAGGKRIRPAFACAAAEAVGGSADCAVPFAAALEMIHTYSLIHDDLPAMDDDAMRRGKPTNHVVFGEGTAILAGDGLLTDAFAVLTRPEVLAAHPPERILRVVAEIAKAAGTGGMVTGQALDLQCEGQHVDLPTLEFLHTHKTGALIRAAVVSGALAGGADPGQLTELTRYAECLGLAFQIADDLLDVESTTATLGKTVGSDEARAKATYVSLLGPVEAKVRARDLMEAALEHAGGFGPAGEPLRALARYVVERER